MALKLISLTVNMTFVLSESDLDEFEKDLETNANFNDILSNSLYDDLPIFEGSLKIDSKIMSAKNARIVAEDEPVKNYL